VVAVRERGRERAAVGSIDTWIGRVHVVVLEGAVVEVSILSEPEVDGVSPVSTDAKVLERSLAQLDEYFRGVRRSFELPLRPEGTPFQKRVWEATSAIPYGETRSYAEVARAVGAGRAARAVGAALSANPIPILIPCHRVVRSDGSPGGYSPDPRIKGMLLRFEAENSGKEWFTGTGRSSGSTRSRRS
jgi:methylated-DNA-[protein]-cysteine S-methyltransferase